MFPPATAILGCFLHPGAVIDMTGERSRLRGHAARDEAAACTNDPKPAIPRPGFSWLQIGAKRLPESIAGVAFGNGGKTEKRAA